MKTVGCSVVLPSFRLVERMASLAAGVPVHMHLLFKNFVDVAMPIYEDRGRLQGDDYSTPSIAW